MGPPGSISQGWSGEGGEGRRRGREGVLLKHERVGFRAGGMGEGVRNGDEGLSGGCRGAGSDLGTPRRDLVRVELGAGGEGTGIPTLRADKSWALQLGRREGSAEAAGAL